MSNSSDRRSGSEIRCIRTTATVISHSSRANLGSDVRFCDACGLAGGRLAEYAGEPDRYDTHLKAGRSIQSARSWLDVVEQAASATPARTPI
jgi:hypothetical protein